MIHIGQRKQSEQQSTYLATPTDSADRTDPPVHTGGGTIDHVCFNCEGLVEFAERLDSKSVEYSERKAHDSTLYQMFMREPINGIKIELNFPIEEAIAAGRTPGWTSEGKAA